MSEALYDCFLIKKIDVWEYIVNNKNLIQQNIISSNLPIANIYPMELLIRMYEKKELGSLEIAWKLKNSTPGLNAYKEALKSNDINLKKYETFLKDDYNNLNYFIDINILNLNLNDYMIIQDSHGILKNLYLADLSFNTSCDGWIDVFKETILKYNLKNSKNKKFTPSSLQDAMCECNFDKPKTKIELYNTNRMWNFIEQSVIINLIKNQVDIVLNETPFMQWKY